jgi:hypothetical protein
MACYLKSFKPVEDLKVLFESANIELIRNELVEDLDAKEIRLRGQSLSWIKHEIILVDTVLDQKLPRGTFLRRFIRENGLLRAIR